MIECCGSPDHSISVVGACRNNVNKRSDRVLNDPSSGNAIGEGEQDENDHECLQDPNEILKRYWLSKEGSANNISAKKFETLSCGCRQQRLGSLYRNGGNDNPGCGCQGEKI
jgi:hypothetical protein